MKISVHIINIAIIDLNFVDIENETDAYYHVDQLCKHTFPYFNVNRVLVIEYNFYYYVVIIVYVYVERHNSVKLIFGRMVAAKDQRKCWLMLYLFIYEVCLPYSVQVVATSKTGIVERVS